MVQGEERCRRLSHGWGDRSLGGLLKRGCSGEKVSSV